MMESLSCLLRGSLIRENLPSNVDSSRLGGAMAKTEELVEICRRHLLPEAISAVLPEPYIPYVPKIWNGVLVLGEAQHLGKRNIDYRKELLAGDERSRFTRLSPKIRVHPWEDFTLPFAVEAALGLVADECAVSNAVLWSQVKENDNNANPSAALVRRAGEFWKEILSAITPKRVIACGRISRSVFGSMAESPNQRGRFVFPLLPSPRATASLIPVFPEARVAAQFPAIARKVLERPEWLKKYRADKIAYACHMAEKAKEAGW